MTSDRVASHLHDDDLERLRTWAEARSKPHRMGRLYIPRSPLTKGVASRVVEELERLTGEAERKDEALVAIRQVVNMRLTHEAACPGEREDFQHVYDIVQGALKEENNGK